MKTIRFQWIVLAVGATGEIVAKQEHRLSPGNRQAKFDHDTLVGRATIDHGKQAIGLKHITKTGLADPAGPTGAGTAELAVSSERLPDPRTENLERQHEIHQRTADRRVAVPRIRGDSPGTGSGFPP